MFRMLLASLIVVVALLGAVSCSKTDASERVTPMVSVTENTIVLDVRTPEEHAEGYLESSRLLDLRSGEFEAAVPSFDPDANYLIYCKSGNRAGQAAERMNAAGINNVTNLGSLQDAFDATGQPIVTR